jgi:pimeloyl-ACP methyl ester carboxylesterase
MPEAIVRGIRINYEVIGTTGPFIALTPGSRRPYAELVGLSKAIAAEGYRVLLHDRRNCGASEVAFDGSGSEHEIWADLCRRLIGRRAAGDPVRHPASRRGARPAAVAPHRRPGGGR